MTRIPAASMATRHADRGAEHACRAARAVRRWGATPSQVGLMRAALFLVCSVLAPLPAVAQDTAIVINPESAAVTARPRELPRSVAEQAIRLFNAATTTRLVGRTSLPPGNEWRGDVGVRNGSVSLGGRIAGTLLVVNGDATLDSTAEVTGDVLVHGGTVTHAPGSLVGGEVRVYREPLSYRTDGGKDGTVILFVSPDGLNTPPDHRRLVGESRPGPSSRASVGDRDGSCPVRTHYEMTSGVGNTSGTAGNIVRSAIAFPLLPEPLVRGVDAGLRRGAHGITAS